MNSEAQTSEPPMTFNGSMNADYAELMMRRAEEAAKELGKNVVIHICDQARGLVVGKAMNGSPFRSKELARKKAEGSALLERTGPEIKKLSGPGGILEGVERDLDISSIEGGYPIFGEIMADSGEKIRKILGGIGISGGHPHEHDAVIARRALGIPDPVQE